MSKIKILALTVISTMLAACGGGEEPAANAPVAQSLSAAGSAQLSSAFANVDQERLANAGSEPEQWLTYGGTYNEL